MKTTAERIADTTIETRKVIAAQIYDEIKQSLRNLFEYYGPESDHSTIRELSSEKEIAQRALAQFGVEVV